MQRTEPENLNGSGKTIDLYGLLQHLTTESAPPRSERSATVQQQIESYLAQLDLESIKQIAETDKDYFPKDFIAQCLMYCYCSSSYMYQQRNEQAALFLDAFTWFVEEFSPISPGYYGLGKSKEEVMDLQYLQDHIEVLGNALDYIFGSISDVFQNLSLVVAKSLIESFAEENCMYDAMGHYMESCDIEVRTPERWDTFKMMVQYMITQTVIDEGEDHEEENCTIGDDGQVLIGHAILWLYVSGIVDGVAPALFSLRRHTSQTFSW